MAYRNLIIESCANLSCRQGHLAFMLDLGKGSGPMNHAFDLQGKFGGGVNHG